MGYGPHMDRVGRYMLASEHNQTRDGIGMKINQQHCGSAIAMHHNKLACSMGLQCPPAGAGAPLQSPLFTHVMDTIGTGAPRLSSFDASSTPDIGPHGEQEPRFK